MEAVSACTAGKGGESPTIPPIISKLVHHMKPITESIIEQSAIETLQSQGRLYINSKVIRYPYSSNFHIFATYNQVSHDKRNN